MNTTLSLNAPDLSLIDVFNKGRAQEVAKGDAAELLKKFTLRGGTAGCITEGGNFLGANPWEALGRFMGFQIPKTKVSRDIFDHGFANEWVWDKYLQMNGEYKVTGDTSYPLVLPKFVGDYDLTGRPDVVLLDSLGKPIMGAELKVVAGTSSAEKVLNGKPKTENLCQAAVYSAGFGIPWSLVYTSYSNFKGRSPLPPGKAEYQIGFDEGRLYFMHKGVVSETIIDIQGIKEWYEGIVAAYQAKDHSWFVREPQCWSGDPDWDPDSYNNFQLMVDHRAAWGDWVKEAEMASKSPVLIEYSTYRRQDVFKVVDWQTMRVLHETGDLEDARTEMRSYW